MIRRAGARAFLHVRFWHICDKPTRPAWVRFWVFTGPLFARQPRRSLTPMYGPAVRRQRFSSSWWQAVLHQCIRPLIGACWAPGHHGNQRACDLISGQTSAGHLGHQCSRAPGRPILHLISSSRRPRRVENGLHHCVFLILGWTIKQIGRPHHQSFSPRSSGPKPERSRRCGPAYWPAQSRARCGAAAFWLPRSRP